MGLFCRFALSGPGGDVSRETFLRKGSAVPGAMFHVKPFSPASPTRAMSRETLLRNSRQRLDWREEVRMTDLPEYRREEPGAQPPALHPAYASTVKRAPQQPAIRLPHTLSEITGPQWDRSVLRPSDADLTRPDKGAPRD